MAYTPGHATHHVSYLHEESGDAYVGDVGRRAHPALPTTIAPTPPPDIDVEAWLDSLHTIACWNAQTLGLTHFGQVTEVTDHLHRMRTALVDSAERARTKDEETFIARMEQELVRHRDPPRRVLRAGRAAEPALHGPRALLAEEGRMTVRPSSSRARAARAAAWTTTGA